MLRLSAFNRLKSLIPLHEIPVMGVKTAVKARYPIRAARPSQPED
jgi:hypothetical protein